MSAILIIIILLGQYKLHIYNTLQYVVEEISLSLTEMV